MTTKKFNAFEYAGNCFSPKTGEEGLHLQKAFDSGYGYVFVVAANAGSGTEQKEATSTALERIQYYFENETDDDIAQVTGNALAYTSSYLFNLRKNNASFMPGELSCLVAVYINEKIYFSQVGDVCAYLQTDRHLLPLLADRKGHDNPGAVKEASHLDETVYMGAREMVTPQSSDLPLEPLAGDTLILASGRLCERLSHYKEIRRLLQDKMPLQTKVTRVLRYKRKKEEPCSAALIMIHFSQINNTTRNIMGAQSNKKAASKGSAGKKTNKGKGQQSGSGKIGSPLRIILAIIGLGLVLFMFYDLFLNDPRPPVDVPTVTTPDSLTVEVPEDSPGTDAAVDPDAVLADDPGYAGEPPEDIQYTVQPGDSWSRIYSQFGVCSWFIINYPRNSGRFGRDDALVAGETLQIPAKYSGNPELNPEYYTFFSTDQVGNACQHAGPELQESFEDMLESQ